MSLIPLEPFFPDNAEEALSVFNDLRVVDATNSPRLGEVSEQWITDFVSAIFGSYESETGRRHISEYFLLISKKNGKSTVAAGIMLTALILNWRHSAEFIIISPTVEIANNSFKPAADMVRADPELQDLFLVQDHIRTITHRVTGATLKVVAADSDTVGGKKAVGVLVDELWLFGKREKAESMFVEAFGGLASRPEGFVIYLSTQSDEPPAGVFKQKLEYARNVRDGVIDDPRFLPVIYEFPTRMIEAEQHLLPQNFYITNPNLGVSVDTTFLEREHKKAVINGEGSLKGFLAKHLNVEIGMNLRSDRWAGSDEWEAAKSPTPITFETLLEKCEVITAGIDGGGLDDLLGVAFVGRGKEDEEIVQPRYKDEDGVWHEEHTYMGRRWYAYCTAVAHPAVLKRRKDIVTKLRDFREAGEMVFAEFIGQDVDHVAKLVGRAHARGLLFQVGLDPNAIGGILDGILQEEVPEDKMVTVNQGWRLAGSIRTTERKLSQRVLRHDGSSLMNWCVGNAKVKLVGNSFVITKQVSGTAKIDPLMALFNAVALMALNPPAQSADINFDLMVVAG